MKIKWQKTHKGNTLLKNEKENFYISHNSSLNYPIDCNCLGAIFGLESPDEETALIKIIDEEKEIYRILVGDFRKDYEKIIHKGYKACSDFFESKRNEFGGDWSTNTEDIANK